MKRSQKYLSSEAHGYLREAKACSLVLKDLERISAKLQRQIDKEAAARQADFEAAMQYHSEAEIQDAYGWEFITEAQYHAYLDLFRRGREAIENHPPTISEMALAIMRKVIRDLESDKREYEFSALTPEQQVVEGTYCPAAGETGPCTQIRGFGGFTALAFLRQSNALPNRQRASLQRDRQTVPLWSAGPFLYKGVEYEEKTISPNAEEIHRND